MSRLTDGGPLMIRFFAVDMLEIAALATFLTLIAFVAQV
jgi:hypothetical protein